jgi:Icc-related predicted phosphoesterase
MHILACADIHGRPERAARVRALVAEHAPDVVLLPGDLTHLGSGEEALTLLHALPVPVLAVPGNMDGPRAVREIGLHGGLAGESPVAIGGVTFGGPRVREACDVIVTHEPPHGTLDLTSLRTRAGSGTVLELLKRLRPKVLACGHIHESAGIERLGGTLVVNCTMGDGRTAGALIDISDIEATARLLGAGGSGRGKPPGL